MTPADAPAGSPLPFTPEFDADLDDWSMWGELGVNRIVPTSTLQFSKIYTCVLSIGIWEMVKR